MKNEHPEVKFGKTGVLLINLGTPDSTNWWDIRKYLKEFLSDRRVIEVNPFLWQIILNLFILTFRPSKTAKAYKKIWMKNINMSPLRYYTEMQSIKLSKEVHSDNIVVDYAMRMSVDNINENGFQIHTRKSSRHPAVFITDLDFADDIALISNSLENAQALLQSLESAANCVGLHINETKTKYINNCKTNNINYEIK